MTQLAPYWQTLIEVSNDSARVAMAASLRGQISERVKAQQQIIVVSAAVAGATISFASNVLAGHPEIMALLCLLYVGLSLALLRQDQEITILADHLLDETAFGREAYAQARWEAHKFVSMQGNVAALVKSAAQTVGIYGVPILAVLATGTATFRSSPNVEAWVILVVAMIFFVLFLIGASDVRRRYTELGLTAQRLLGKATRRSV